MGEKHETHTCGSQREYSLEEVGMALGTSRERARQIELKALAKCRAWCESRGLDPAEMLIGREREPDYHVTLNARFDD